MVDIPPEIWAQIAQHLPRDMLISMISVNRTFYTLALDEKYNELAMREISGSFTRKLEALKNPEYAKRVKVLHLEPPCLHELANYQKLHPPELHNTQQRSNSIKDFAGWFFQSLLPAKQAQEEPPVSATEIADTLTDLLPRLHGVSRFSLTWENASTFHAPYLDSTWNGLSANLQELHLDLHPQFAAIRLPLDANFPQLAALRITLCPTYTDEPETMIVSLTKFINKLEGSLKSLHIGSLQRRDLGEMYSGLSQFPKLQHVEVSPQTFVCPSTMIQFLQNHSDTLSSIIYTSDSNKLYINGLSDLQLENLQELTMKLHYTPYPTAWWTVPSPFFTSIGSTMKRLTIEGAVTLKELSNLLTALAGVAAPALEELSISIGSLSAHVLVGIAEKLPDLHSLDLRIHDVVEKSLFPKTPGEFFPYDSDTSYQRQTTPEQVIQSAKELLPQTGWQLRNITIKRRSCCGDLMLWGLMQLCAECIPTIRSFAKRGTKAIPNPPNSKPPGKNLRCSGFVCAFGGEASVRGPSRDFSP